jgi:hypothetical protein
MPIRRYVVEHRTEDGSAVVAVGTPQLAPIAAHLSAQGQAGDLVVVDADSGTVLIRWRLGRARSAEAEPDDATAHSPSDQWQR